MAETREASVGTGGAAVELSYGEPRKFDHAAVRHDPFPSPWRENLKFGLVPTLHEAIMDVVENKLLVVQTRNKVWLRGLPKVNGG